MTAPAAVAQQGSEPAKACPKSPFPVGIYRLTIHPSDVKRMRRYAPELASFIVGQWTVGIGVADPNCYYTHWAVFRVNGRVAFVDSHPFTVPAPGEVTYHGAGECAGTYRIIRQGNEFWQKLIADCPTGRPEVHTIGPWVLVSPGP